MFIWFLKSRFSDLQIKLHLNDPISIHENPEVEDREELDKSKAVRKMCKIEVKFSSKLTISLKDSL